MSNVVIIKTIISIEDYERWQEETEIIEKVIEDEMDLVIDANGARIVSIDFEYKKN